MPRSTRYVRSLLRLRCGRAGLAPRVDDRARRGRRRVRLRATAGRRDASSSPSTRGWTPVVLEASRSTASTGDGSSSSTLDGAEPDGAAGGCRRGRRGHRRGGSVGRPGPHRRGSCVSRTEADRSLGRVALYSRLVADLPIDLDARARRATRRGTRCRGQDPARARGPRSDHGTGRGPRRRCRRTPRSTAQRPRRTGHARRLEWTGAASTRPTAPPTWSSRTGRRSGTAPSIEVGAGSAAAAARRPIARRPRLRPRRRRRPARRAARVHARGAGATGRS